MTDGTAVFAVKTVCAQESVDNVETEIESIKSTISTLAEKAGVIAGDVSSESSWWVKFGGTIPLIIQGGKLTNCAINDGRTYTFTLPVKMMPLGAQVSIQYGSTMANASCVAVQSITSTEVKVTCSARYASYTTNIYVLAIGIAV